MSSLKSSETNATLQVVGSICFCLGVQHSQYYTKVNCGDGAGLWPPIVNMVSYFKINIKLQEL